jgi:phosphate transport system permease protein
MTSIIDTGRRQGWRRSFNRIMRGLILLSVVIAIIPLVLVVADVVVTGLSAINWAFFTSIPPSPCSVTQIANGTPGCFGGIVNGIQGSMLMVGLGALVAVPVGIGAGIFFSEWPESRISFFSSFTNDVLAGFPTITIGLFIYVILVVTTRRFSALAGATALAIVMIPIVARTTEESLKIVPNSLREASMALGVPRWKTVFRVVISTGKSGLATGILLAIARATGETAPLVITANYLSFPPTLASVYPGEPTASVPYIIYNFGTSGYPNWVTTAWGAALVLVAFMLILNISVKYFIGRKFAGVRAEI